MLLWSFHKYFLLFVIIIIILWSWWLSGMCTQVEGPWEVIQLNFSGSIWCLERDQLVFDYWSCHLVTMWFQAFIYPLWASISSFIIWDCKLYFLQGLGRLKVSQASLMTNARVNKSFTELFTTRALSYPFLHQLAAQGLFRRGAQQKSWEREVSTHLIMALRMFPITDSLFSLWLLPVVGGCLASANSLPNHSHPCPLTTASFFDGLSIILTLMSVSLEDSPIAL